MKIGTSGSPSASRNCSVNAVICVGVSTFRLNRMKPQGRSDRKNERSSVLSSVPATPAMKAFMIGPNSPRPARGSRKGRLILLDDALAAGALQAAAELGGFLRCAEWPDHGAVVDALFPEVGTLDQRRLRPQDRWVLVLQRLEGGLCIGFVSLRGHLHEISAASRDGSGRRRVRRGRCKAAVRIGRRCRRR